MKPSTVTLTHLHPGHVPAFAIANNLQSVDAPASDWMLYLFLAGLCHHQQRNPATTTVTRLRNGSAADDGYGSVGLSVNTIKAGLARLEEAGLIRIESRRDKVAVLLDIYML